MGKLIQWIGLAVCLLAGVSGYGQSRAIVDYRADDAFPVPAGDSTATAMVGNVAFHHNGAILTCDSALRYGPDYIECFNNVIINKDSTYVYGDRADFNGITNIARVYAPLVKTVDGDMTMYSYDMEFNTLTNIGRFTRSGTISQKDNLMEAIEAIYHADERQIYFIREVLMRNEEYLIRTDSMGYNFDTEITTFYKPAQIWNKDGDFLSADQGSYDRINDTYIFTENSYILTERQEIFADSMNYLKGAGLAYLFNHIQLHDEEQSAYLFGDYGVYWVEDQQAIMTDNPSAIGYEEGEQPDSVFLRGDTIALHTFPGDQEFTPQRAARLRLPGREQLDSVQRTMQDSLFIERPDSLLPDSLSNWGHLYGADADSMVLERGMRGRPPLDSLARASLPDSLRVGLPPDSPDADTFSPDSLLRSGMAGDVAGIPEALPDTGDETPPEILPDESPGAENGSVAENISVTGKEENTVPTRRELRRQKRAVRQEERLQEKREKMREYAIREGLTPAVDSAALQTPDSLPVLDSIPAIAEEETAPKDSLQRVIRSYRNVKIFREDLQAVCDSLVAFSIDSTAHMYINPVLWSEENQVVSDSIYIFSRDQQLDRAEFMGNPIMSQWVLDSLFNQIVGDRLEAYFKGGDIDRLEVIGNAKTYYYMQEEDKPDDIGSFLDIVSQDITIEFDSARVTYITYKGDPVYSMFPMDKIPVEHTQRFPQFKWMAHRRPASQYEVVDRVLRPSQRERTESIPYPRFRLTEQIDGDKQRFLENGTWRDRNDVPWLQPSYFQHLVR